MIGREKELQFIKDGFSRFGHLRCAIVLGPEGIGKTVFLERAKELHSSKENKSICITPDSDRYADLPSLLSSMARNISCGSHIEGNQISKFARFYGSQLVQIEATHRTENNSEDFNTRLAETFVTGLEDAIIHCGLDLDEIVPLFVIDDIDKIEDSALEWLCVSFNKRIRESSLFSKCRFLFSAKNITEKIEQFFSRFGFDKTSEVNLSPFTAKQCVQLAKTAGYEISNGEDYRTKSQGNPLKLLNILKKPTTILKEDINAMSNIDKTNIPTFSNFSEKELNYLLFASYPSVINRYNLEFFCSARDAAFCFNWLKRQKKIAQLQPGGDIIMDEEFRNQMRDFHKQEEPEEAEKMSNTATILDTFTSIFPNPNQHWIPVNLQLFDSFTKNLCRKLFNEMECDEIDSILEIRDDVFNISNKQYVLNDEVKLVTQRFIEIGGGSPKEDICEKAKDEWLKYQEDSTERRSRLEHERTNFEEEAFDAEKQIISLDELRKQLAENHKQPSGKKSKREYSFSTSAILIAIGLGTTGASLFLDSLGTYHAAAGLILTIFGFFWPSVETKKQAVKATAKAPKLAIETQQRSLSHRISGLATRISSIRGNLENLNSDLENLDHGMNVPYISD